MSEELKPCPFCVEDEYNPAGVIADVEEGVVGCYNIYCRIQPQTVGAENIEEAIAVWNTRPIEDDLRAELVAANKRLEEYDAAWIGAAETEDALRAELATANAANERYDKDCVWYMTELARKDEENNKLLNVLWTAEDMVAGWHPNRDSHDKIKELSSAIKSARAAVDGMREGVKS